MHTHTAPIEDEAALRRIGQLSPINQQVLIWRHGLFGEPRLSHQEIAGLLNLSAGTVRVLEQRALREPERPARAHSPGR